MPERGGMVYCGQRPKGENEARLGKEEDETHPKHPHDCKAAPGVSRPDGRTIARGGSKGDHAGQRLQHTDVPGALSAPRGRSSQKSPKGTKCGWGIRDLSSCLRAP